MAKEEQIECRDCGAKKDLSCFHFKDKVRGTRNTQCKECQTKYHRSWYHKNKKKVLKQVAKRNKAHRERNRLFVLDYLSDKECADCLEKDSIVLEFDHLRDKKYNISFMVGQGHSIRLLKEEISKCEVVCRNCHARRTYKRAGSYRLWDV